MDAFASFVLHYGYWLLFGWVFLEQLGLPIPSAPMLLAMGALAGLGRYSFIASVLLTMFAALLSDAIWYRVGRWKGHAILNLLCRLSLEPDSCISNTKSIYRRMGPFALLFAKFVPGLNTVAAPMAGVTRMSYGRFFLNDAAGALIWSLTLLGSGYVFRAQLEQVADVLLRFGSGLFGVAALVLLSYLSWKWYKRQSFIRGLRVARISPQDLKDMLDANSDVVIVDMRDAMDIELNTGRIPGALWISTADLEQRHDEIPREREVILYCS